jgi:serine-type D-Ala-D-Ala carboxypeptidase/endopeptidase (penicillin-binding protein 4)
MRDPRSLAALFLLVGIAGCTVPVRTTVPAPHRPGTLSADIESLVRRPELAHAHVGVSVRTLDGSVVYEHNAGRLFVPASNQKLLTGAGMLEALGPDYRHRTRVFATAAPQGGVLRGDLVVVGGGDPTISRRFAEDSRAVFRQWADSLRSHGITRIAGHIVGVDTVFDAVPYGRGWAWDDLNASYAPRVSGLGFQEGAIQVTLFPGAGAGTPGLVSLDPPTSFVPVVNEVVTAPAGEPAQWSARWTGDRPHLLIEGRIPADTPFVQSSFAVLGGATAFFVHVLRETLRDAGITVEGPAVDAREWEGVVPRADRMALLFVHHSPSLEEVLVGMMKPSQNFMAEMMLRTLGRELRQEGSLRAGGAAVDSLLLAWGLPAAEAVTADGSGLSRMNLLSPGLIAGLLVRMHAGPYRSAWWASLPVAGRDGTLRGRFLGTPAEGRVVAKTGTLTGVRPLAGYAPTAAGDTLVFAVIVSPHALTAREVDSLLIEPLVLRLATWAGPPR